MRESISLDGSFRGDRYVAAAATRIVRIMLREIFLIELFHIFLSPVTNANPKLRNGPIRGEMSIAPIITGELFVMRPHKAMRLAILRIRKYPAVVSTSELTLLMMPS